MNFRRRLERLEKLAVALSPANKNHTNRFCKDMQWEEILPLVQAAFDAGDADCELMEKIMAFVAEAAATPLLEFKDGKNGEPVLDEQGKQIFDHHFFDSWLWGLQAGSWTLPERLPRSFLEGFCSRYGMVRQRCEDCLCGLGNAIGYDVCPICYSKNLSHKYLSGPT